MNSIKNICVFASSSNHLEPKFYSDARELGLLIGNNNFNIVYGGSKLGLMYACAGAVKEAGGRIIGIMPEKIASFGCANPEDCDEFILTSGMRERKATLDKVSEAVIALPGGYGTLEELAEIIVQKQLGYNNKPIVILNTLGFYDKLVEFFDVIIERSFANEASKNLFYIAKIPNEAIEYIKNYVPIEYDVKYVKAKF